MTDNDPLNGEAWALRQGESLELLHRLPDGSIDALITDPPYSSGGMVRGDRADTSARRKYTDAKSSTQAARPDWSGDNRDQRGYAYWCALWLAEALRVARPGALALIFTDWRQLPITTDALQSGGWVWRGIVPWDKTGAVRPRLGGFAAQAEYVVWGTAGPLDPDRNPVALDGVIRHYHRQDDRHHLTGKPTPVMRELVRACPPGGIVLDPFAGSGTTGVAAIEEGRRFLGFEREPSYAAIARDRLDAAVPTLLAESDPGEQLVLAEDSDR